jgi:micrococcal nuclease
MEKIPLTHRQKKTIASGIITILLVIFGVTTAAHKTAPAPHKKAVQKLTITIDPTKLYEVGHVADGDTISVNVGGQVLTVRLLGINTPETVDPRRPVQCFGKEASNKMKEILGIAGTSSPRVHLVIDSSQGDTDKYGRLLAYVTLDNGLEINQYMISEGYAYEYTYNTPYLRQAEFKAAELAAKTLHKGLWDDAVCPVKEGQPKSKKSATL